MPESCTCGAQLPPEARFCHKCGKPQFEMPVLEPEPEDQPVQEPLGASVQAEAPRAPDVGFRNPVAVRIGLLVALLSLFTSALPGVLPFVGLVAAGFFSVHLYRRRTGVALTTGSGARMGWMTGLFAFLIALVLLSVLVLAISNPDMAARLLEEARNRGADVNAQHLIDAFQTPLGVIEIVLASFVLFTLFPTIGGALGAKLLGGRTRS